MKSIDNVLVKKGIIKPSGEIGKDKINLVAGAITQPFAEMVWVTTGGDMETINRLTDILVSMNTPADRGKLFKIIKMLYGLIILPLSLTIWQAEKSKEDNFMKQGALIFDELTDRYDIRFDLADYYGGLHCGDCLEVFAGGKWKPTRMEYGKNWYLVGIRTEDLNGLRVRI